MSDSDKMSSRFVEDTFNIKATFLQAGEGAIIDRSYLHKDLGSQPKIAKTACQRSGRRYKGGY